MNREAIWFFERGYYKVFIEKLELRQKIERWEEAMHSCEYEYPNGRIAWDFIIPSSLYNRAAELLGVPLRVKNGNRVKAGLRVQKLNSHYRFTKVNVGESCSEGAKITN